MRLTNIICAMILIIGFWGISYAEIFKKEDGTGITYSDSPSSNAEAVIVPEANTVPTSSPEKTLPSALPTTVRKPYTKFLISSPKDKETIPNQPNIFIVFETEPGLQPGDKIQAYVDGKAVGAATESPQINLGRLDRGQHVVQGAILNQQQMKIKESNSVIIFVHYASVALQKKLG